MAAILKDGRNFLQRQYFTCPYFLKSLLGYSLHMHQVNNQKKNTLHNLWCFGLRKLKNFKLVMAAILKMATIFFKCQILDAPVS